MFNEDLKIGELAQDYVADILSDHFNREVFTSTDLAYDLYLDNGRKIEVKYNRMTEKTGNVAFEYEYKGKPSGIKKSPAHYWVYLIGGTVYLTTRDKLLLWFLHNHNDCKKVTGGDGNHSKLILLNMKQFNEVFTRI